MITKRTAFNYNKNNNCRRILFSLSLVVLFIVLSLDSSTSSVNAARQLREDDNNENDDEVEIGYTTSNNEEDNSSNDALIELSDEPLMTNTETLSTIRTTRDKEELELEMNDVELSKDEEIELAEAEEEVKNEAEERNNDDDDKEGEIQQKDDSSTKTTTTMSTEQKQLSPEEVRERNEQQANDIWDKIKGQPQEGREKDLIEKIVSTHALETAPRDGFLMKNADSECGASGPFALLTLWNSVNEFKRRKIIDFFSQTDEDISTSEPNWGTVAVKSLKLAGVFSTKFAGEGEPKRQCIANFLTNNKMRQLDDVNKAKGIETSRPHHTERERELAKGKQAMLLRNYVLTKILPSIETLEARGASDEATVLVLALNCKVDKRRALLFALFDALISSFKLNTNDVALSLGRRHVTQDMYELINQSPKQFLADGDDDGEEKIVYNIGDAAINVKAGICPTLIGNQESELDHLDRAHSEARNHFAQHHTENHHDPTNPHHQHTHGSHQMGSLPGMQSIFGEGGGNNNNMKMPGGRGGGENRAKSMGMSAFGMQEHSGMRGGANEPRRQKGTQPKSNYVPTLEDPLQNYLRASAGPRSKRPKPSFQSSKTTTK